MRLVFATLTVASLLSVTHSAQAIHPRRHGAYNKQAAIAAYGRATYPKYYWGFYARELQNIGVSHGDIGMLGSGLTRDPW